jgi:large subunit ribosomal protein L13
MDTQSYKTKSANSQSVEKQWYIVDAEDMILGRMAARIAMVLRGKHKPYFTPHADCGDYVIVINAEKVKFTGKKLDDKVYVRHTGYPGGQRFATPRELLAKKPEAIIEHAVKGMLPKNILGSELYRHLYVYAGTEHPHQGQNPQLLNLNTIK